MSELIFPCPSCNQNIQCDPSLGGHELICPLCNATVTAPSAAGTPKQGTKLGVAATTPHTPPKAPTGPVHVGPKKVSALDNTIAREKRGRYTKMAVGALVLAGLIGAAVYFVSNPDKFQEFKTKIGLGPKPEEAAAAGGGGGPIKELNQALAATDPKNAGGTPQASGNPAAPAPDPNAPPKPQPIIPASFTLDVDSMDIPKSQPNGSVGGATFVADNIQLQKNVLIFRQGTNAPDRELLVYLKTKPGENLEGKTLVVATNERTGPSVVKRWKTNPRYAPSSKTFATGYAMKLEFGKAKDGQLPAKVYLALPDAEQTFVAGNFKLGKLAPGQNGFDSSADSSAKIDPTMKARYGLK